MGRALALLWRSQCLDPGSDRIMYGLQGSKKPVDGITLFVKFPARLTDLELPLTRHEQDRISWARVFLLNTCKESWLIPTQSEASAGRQHDAHVAQLAEHVLGKDEVTGSIPVMGSMPDPDDQDN